MGHLKSNKHPQILGFRIIHNTYVQMQKLFPEAIYESSLFLLVHTSSILIITYVNRYAWSQCTLLNNCIVPNSLYDIPAVVSIENKQ